MGAYGSKRFRDDLEALKSNDPTLQSLNYEQGGLGDEGARALAEALRSNRTLRRLQLGQCGLTAVGLRRLVRALGDTSITPCHLRRLDLSTSSAPPLGNAVGDNGAKCLAYLLSRAASLRHLNAANCNIGDEGAVSIAQAVAISRSLRNLDLSYNSISDIGAEQLGSALGSTPCLQGLSLWSNRIFHSGAEALANGLAANTSLRWLGLGCNHVGDEGVKAIAIALLSNSRQSKLVWLALGGNQVTDKGAEHIAVALRAQQSNSQVAVESGEAGEITSQRSQASLSEQVRAGGLRPMLELGVTPSHLSMAVEEKEEGREEDKGGRGEEEGEESYCVPLESLGLGGNQITDAGAKSLVAGLQSNTKLLSLGLADNRIGDEGASALADLLRQSDTLQRLVLSGNEIRDEGGSKLVASLSQNRSLKGLYLAGNPCGNAVGARCQEVVGRYNSTLKTLDVHGTPMSTPAISSLVDTMRRGGVLHSLATQPLPQQGSALPSNGNILEMEAWQPVEHTTVLQRRGQYPRPAPSQRQTTLEALGSLPPPEESAQALVVRAGQGEPRPPKRHGSISDFFGRVSRRGSRIFSRKDAVADSEGSSRAEPPPAKGRRPGSAKTRNTNIELQPLVEEERDEEGQRDPLRTPAVVVEGQRDLLRTPTMVVEGQRDPLRTPTVVVKEQRDPLRTPTVVVEGQMDPLRTPSVVVEEERDLLRTPTVVVEGEQLERHEVPTRNKPRKEAEPVQGNLRVEPEQTTPGVRPAQTIEAEPAAAIPKTHFVGQPHNPQFYDRELDAVERNSSLHSLTKDRPHPPTNRRLPSREHSPQKEPGGVARIGGITRQQEGEGEPFVYDAANRMLASCRPIEHSEDPDMHQSDRAEEKPLKEQWAVALAKRVGILKMGGFLHSGFNAVMAADSTHNHQFAHARLPRNMAKNREGAPLPPSHTRVKLQLVFEEVGSDYINASFVGSPAYPKSYMVTQQPLEETVEDFWRMVWEHRVSVVVVLEEGEGEGCWKPEVGEEDRYSLVVSSSWIPDALSVRGMGEEGRGVPGVLVRRVQLDSSLDADSQVVQLFHYQDWPQNGVPEDPRGVAKLFHRVLQARQLQAIPAPVLVMSTLGAGRAGCFCAVGVAYELMRSPEEEPQGWDQDTNILNQVICGLRGCRPRLVESQQQFEFCHRVLEEVLWGKGEGEDEGDGGQRTGRWKLFGGKRKNKKNTGKKPTKPVKTTKPVKSSKASKTHGPLLEEEGEGDWQAGLLY